MGERKITLTKTLTLVINFRYTWDHVNNKSTTCPLPSPRNPPICYLSPPFHPSPHSLSFSQVRIIPPLSLQHVGYGVILLVSFLFWVYPEFSLFLSPFPRRFFIHRFLLTSPLYFSFIFTPNTLMTELTDACLFSLFS